MMDEPVGGQLDGVAKQWEIEVCGSIDEVITETRTSYSDFSRSVVMDRVAFGLADLATCKETLFVITPGHRLHIGQGVLFELMSEETFQTGFGIFVESFQQGDGEGVLQDGVPRLVVEAVALIS